MEGPGPGENGDRSKSSAPKCEENIEKICILQGGLQTFLQKYRSSNREYPVELGVALSPGVAGCPGVWVLAQMHRPHFISIQI